MYGCPLPAKEASAVNAFKVGHLSFLTTSLDQLEEWWAPHSSHSTDTSWLLLFSTYSSFTVQIWAYFLYELSIFLCLPLLLHISCLSYIWIQRQGVQFKRNKFSWWRRRQEYTHGVFGGKLGLLQIAQYFRRTAWCSLKYWESFPASDICRKLFANINLYKVQKVQPLCFPPTAQHQPENNISFCFAFSLQSFRCSFLDITSILWSALSIRRSAPTVNPSSAGLLQDGSMPGKNVNYLLLSDSQPLGY